MKVRLGGQIVDVQPTIADRVINYFDPVKGTERLRARTMLALAGGYQSGRRDRRATRNWRPRENSANADTLPDLPDLRARSRDLVRNVPLATGAISTNVTNVVGDGLTLKASVDHEFLGLTEEQGDTWEKSAEREFSLFGKTCDFTRSQHFGEMQRLVLRSVLESGDIFVVRRFRRDPGDSFGTKLQLIEADRVCNPNRAADTFDCMAGIELDGSGIPTGCHIADRHPDDLTGGKPVSWTKVPFRGPQGDPLVVHLFDRLRPDQLRGVPYLAPVIEAIHQLGKYTEAEVRAAVISGMFTAFIKTDPLSDGEPAPIGTDSSEAGVSDPNREIALEDAGAIVELDVGQSVDIANPGRPNPAFDAFVTSASRQIGVALELPFELLIKHFTASYSASRAALEMAWQFFRRMRAWLSRRFCQIAYEWAIEEAIAAGRMAAPGFFANPLIRQAYLGAEWIGPARINLDPKKEAEADSIDIDLGTKTRDQVITERTGGTFERKNAQLKKEEAMRRDAGLGAAPVKKAPPPSSPVEDENPDDVDNEDEQ